MRSRNQNRNSDPGSRGRREDQDNERYRGRESYEQQYRQGEGGMSDMWDRRSYPRNQQGYSREDDWDQRYRGNESELGDYDRGRPERGGYGSFGRPDDRSFRNAGRFGGAEHGYGERGDRYGGGNDEFAEGSRERGGFGGSYGGGRSAYGSGYESGYDGGAYGSGSYGRGPYGRASNYEGGMGAGMSLDDGRFSTRPNYMGGMQQRRSGNAPKGYKRSDERIREDVCDRLSDRWDVDSRGIEVSVSNGEVTLSGAVPERTMKFRAENIADGVSGVLEVHNQLRVQQQQQMGGGE